MKAVILAGGDGKRLRPVTCTMPKPMVPLLNKPTIFYTLDLLKLHGVKEAVITLGYMGNTIREAVGGGEKWGMSVDYSDPPKRLGTAGSVREAITDDGEVLVLSGDGITDADLSSAIEAHRRKNACVTVMLYHVSDPSEYGIAVADSEGFIKKFIEKPESSEVFSDRANTGIYVLSEKALSMIPKGEEYDFSKDLFPKLLSEGERILGFDLDGYWCDVGDIFAYRKAQEDMLDGKMSFETEAEDRGGVFVEKGAMISSEAVIDPPCYIGRGAEIGSMTLIGQYSVISDGVKIMEGASVKRSIVMKNATVRRLSELRGTVVCENADIDSRDMLLEGSVIGAGAVMEKNVTVNQNVLIWPDKRIVRGTNCMRDVVWGRGEKARFDCPVLSGYADRELEPETVLLIAASFAHGMDEFSEAGLAADGSPLSVMFRQAAASGMLSQGVDVVTADGISRSAFGYMIRNSGLAGGIRIEGDAFQRAVTLRFYGKDGTEADPATIRNIEKNLNSGSVKPTTSSEIGIIRYGSGLGIEYEAYLMRRSDTEALKRNSGKLIVNAEKSISDAVSRMLLKLGWTVDTLSERKKLIPTHNSDAVSVLVDDQDRLSFFINGVGAVDPERTLAVLASGFGLKKAYLPSETDEELVGYLKGRGTEVVFSPADAAKRRIKAMREGEYEPLLLEPEAGIIGICELFAGSALRRELSALPVSHKRTNEVSADKCDFGRMLRTLIENEYERVSDMVDGVRLKYDSGWVTVRPGDGGSTVRIVAGSRDSEYSKELCDVYSEKLRKMQRNNRS
ncbi:MAG: NTP transferase domain-containing protein [Clostridia bacterium]|nr:NTP transferase domain-containing protein [Clostridia bacterium]